ncbi:MAG: sigma 54-interacting transcriptional regulator [Thermodesulfobacteriota bacterium]
MGEKKAGEKRHALPKNAAGLRRRATERLKQKQAGPESEDGTQGSFKDRRALHELQVHQIELEMQNEELRKAQEELDASRTRYQDLYDLAPVGYCTVGEKGEILEANLTAATLLGMTRAALVRQLLTRFILKEDRDIYHLHHARLIDTHTPQVFELRMSRKDGVPFWVRLQANAAQEDDGASLHRVVMSDITEQKELEEKLRKSHDELEKRVEERTSELSTCLSEIRTMKDQLEAENVYFRQEIKMKHPLAHILGQSDGLKYVLYRAEQVAPANTTVLILGETGTGKELIAYAIHDMSPRKERPLVTVNCAALPGNLIESELFGREKGAFTGADTRQVGRFEIAHGSTICLDEIGELPLELQAKLLRAIQHNEFERLGSPQTVKVDVRIIATTNRNLEEEVRKGRFRQNLYYRLNVFPITVPPLRQRREDIPLMVQAFIERYARKLGKKITSIQKETLQALQNYPWPGNVRELESIIERAVILCPGPVLHLADKLESSSPVFSSAVRTLEETERNQILKILSETHWRIEGKRGAAAILGLQPSTLRARMHKLGIARPGKKETA